MLALIVGGSGSGKSEMAEALCRELGGSLLYLATMEPQSPEALERVARHRAQRRGKGFATVERYRDIERLKPPPYKTVLLECLGNLAANEMFGGGIPGEKLPGKLMEGVQALYHQAEHLVVVSNDIFSGSQQFGGEMTDYLSALGKANAALAASAGVVIESVSGIPLLHKGALPVQIRKAMGGQR